MKAMKILFALMLVAGLGSTMQAQIGIGTTTPNGILDLNTDNLGLVFPTVSLTSTIVESPVTNPDGSGSLAVGTTVYNDNITFSGANDVHTGLYTWTGTYWAPQFIKKEYVRYEQTSVAQRIEINPGSNPDSGNQTMITGLTGQTFVPSYSGVYRVEVKSNFGGGRVTDFSSAGGYDDISLCTTEGSFFFTMNGPGVDIDPTSAFYDYSEGWSYTHSYSAHNDSHSPAIENENMTHDGTLLYYLYLQYGQTYNFDLGINLYTGDGYLDGNGAAGTDGRGYVGSYLPCSVSFEYIGD